MAKIVIGTCPTCGIALRAKEHGVQSTMQITCRCGWQGQLAVNEAVVNRAKLAHDRRQEGFVRRIGYALAVGTGIIVALGGVVLIGVGIWANITDPKKQPTPSPPDMNKLWREAEVAMRKQLLERKKIASLIDSLTDENPAKRMFAARALAEYGPKAKPAVPSLVAVMKDEKEELAVRFHAILALGAIGPEAKEAVNPLIEVLQKDKEWGVRGHAARTLGDIGAKAAVNPLTEAMKDPEAGVREEVAIALGKLQSK